MKHNDQRWLDQAGLNVIRIVIGSYFMAVSLDLIDGVDQTALFIPFLSFFSADLVGSSFLFAVSVCFMVGIQLRSIALILAMFVMISSIIENFVAFEPGNVSNFWRDVTLVAAVILSYSNLGRREMRRASVLARRARARRVHMQENVVPRRVTLEKTTKRPSHGNNAPIPLRPKATYPAEPPQNEEEIVNLFANV